MTIVEPSAGELFTGLGKHAETHLPPRWAARKERLRAATITALVLFVQVAWVGALAYAAYRFLS